VKLLLFIFFALGLFLAVMGWSFEQIYHYPWLMRITAPEYAHGIDALELLTSERDKKITSEHPGFEVLLKRWPGLGDKPSVSAIGISYSYIAYDDKSRTDFELVALDSTKNELKPRWKVWAAMFLFRDELEVKVFQTGWYLFISGILIAFVSGLIEFLRKPAVMEGVVLKRTYDDIADNPDGRYETF